MLQQTIGFIGAGQMATALARGFVDAGLCSGDQICFFDPSTEAAGKFAAAVEGCHAQPSGEAVVAEANVVVVAVKPQYIGSVMTEVSQVVTSSELLISIVAGVPLDRLIEGLGSPRVIRVMPNTPCLVGRGAAGFALGSGASDEDAQLVDTLFNAVGVAFRVEERLLDAVTGLSGSGPAFVFTLIEALSDGGVRMGLPRVVATALATQTVLGSAELVMQTGEHPAVLRERVASPGGTTIAGLQELENHAARAAMIAAVESATKRSIELGQES